MHYFLPEVSEQVIDFNEGGKNMPLKIEDDNVLVKYNEIWNKVKKILNIKFHSKPVYDEKYIKLK